MSDLLKKEISLKGLFKRRGGTAASLEDVETPETYDENTERVREPVVLAPFSPRRPEINIVPGYLLEEYKTVAIRNKFLAAIVALVLAFAGLYVFQALTASSNEQSLEALNARTTEVNSEVQKLRVYEQYEQNVLGKRKTIGETMNTEISLGTIAESLNTAASAHGIQITGMSINVNADPTSATGECVNPDPFTTTSSVGCVTFTGTANDRGSVEGFLQTLEGTDGFVIPYIPNYVSGEGEDGNAISGSVAFTEQFQSQRYKDLLSPLNAEAPADTEGTLPEGEEVNP